MDNILFVLFFHLSLSLTLSLFPLGASLFFFNNFWNLPVLSIALVTQPHSSADHSTGTADFSSLRLVSRCQEWWRQHGHYTHLTNRCSNRTSSLTGKGEINTKIWPPKIKWNPDRSIDVVVSISLPANQTAMRASLSIRYQQLWKCVSSLFVCVTQSTVN